MRLHADWPDNGGHLEMEVADEADAERWKALLASGMDPTLAETVKWSVTHQRHGDTSVAKPK